MKLLILAAFVGVCAAGALPNSYLPPQYRAGAGAAVESSRPNAAFERNAAILRSESEVNENGFHYAYETENGIRAEESGQEANGIQSQGGYSYTGDDGQVYSVRFTAGADGFQPQGDHLPTPPPIPEEILKALEQNARDEASGIFDDGTYQAGKYGGAESGAFAAARAQSQPSRQYLSPSFNSQTGYRY